MPQPVEEPEHVPDEISVTIVRVGEDMGDHGETTYTTVTIGEDLSIREVMELLLPQTRWLARNYTHRVELKFEQRIEVKKFEQPAPEIWNKP